MVDEAILATIRSDFAKTIESKLVESYSFEYAYRLFLVLCSTKPSVIHSLSSSEIDVLEPTFLSGMKACIADLNVDKGLAMEPSVQEKYASFATSTLIRYLKGGMGTSPVSLAGQVARSMEEKLYEDGILDKGIQATKVFVESRA